MSENAPSIVEEAYDAEKDSYTLTSGDKDLVVSFTGKDEIQTTIIDKPVFSTGPSVPGSTTAVYSRARELMQARANRLGKPLTYIFSTGNPNMIEWARGRGQEVFGWEKVDDPKDIKYFEGQKIFRPESAQ